MKHRASQPRTGDETTGEMVAWRRRRLQRAGFEPTLAQTLAADGLFDLHVALGLVDRDCPPGRTDPCPDRGRAPGVGLTPAGCERGSAGVRLGPVLCLQPPSARSIGIPVFGWSRCNHRAPFASRRFRDRTRCCRAARFEVARRRASLSPPSHAPSTPTERSRADTPTGRPPRDRPAAMTTALEREGIRSFCGSSRQLLAGIESRLGVAAATGH